MADDSLLADQYTECVECGGFVLSKSPGGYVTVEELREEMAENARLRGALQMIADQTICPELFPDDDVNGAAIQIKSALVIAIGALEGKVGGCTDV